MRVQGRTEKKTNSAVKIYFANPTSFHLQTMKGAYIYLNSTRGFNNPAGGKLNLGGAIRIIASLLRLWFGFDFDFTFSLAIHKTR